MMRLGDRANTEGDFGIYIVRQHVWEQAGMGEYGQLSVHRLSGKAYWPQTATEGFPARASDKRQQRAGDATPAETAGTAMTFNLEQFRARLRAAGPPPSFDHLHDPDLLRRLTINDVVVDDDDSVEDAEPKRKRRPTLAARPATLPPTLPPRLISRDAAAAYVGVSPNTFDKMIADGLMPNPRQLTERRLAWDVRQLDAAIDRLPVDGVPTPTPTQQPITVGMT